jgi:hypothetical protein
MRSAEAFGADTYVGRERFDCFAGPMAR